jgi:Fe-S oxidoreductase
MERFAERSFCCGAGGARMWMEERIGKRINVERVEEAVGTGAKTIAAACPFCLTMLNDGLTQKKSAGEAGDDVEVVDVATVLLRAVKPGV